MEPQNHPNWKLITRILSGEADESDKRNFQQWLNEDPANQHFFKELKSSWEEEPDNDAVESAFLFDYDSGLNKLRDKLKDEENIKQVTSKNKSINNNHFMGWKVAASILFVIVLASVFTVFLFSTPSMVSYATTNVEQRIINLPDGSKVRLNKNSKISFAKGFPGSKRVINLSGEAFFHVNHNENKPFIIHVGNAVIRDIGTSFNVNESNNGHIIVAVKNGIVSFRNNKMNKGEATILQKNQVGILKDGDITKIKSNEIQNYLSWISGKIVFKKASFDDVIRQLNHIYGIHCQLADSSLTKLKLTAYIRNTSLYDVLHMISLSLGIKYHKEGNKIIWMPKDQDDHQIQSEEQRITN